MSSYLFTRSENIWEDPGFTSTLFSYAETILMDTKFISFIIRFNVSVNSITSFRTG